MISSKINKEKEDKEGSLLDSIIAGTGQAVYNIPEAGLGILGLLQLAPELSLRTIDAVTSPSYSLKDAWDDSIENNIGFNLEQDLSNFLAENNIRKKTEDLNDAERSGRFVGSLIPIFGANYINKGSNIIKNAANVGSDLNKFKNAKTITNKLANEGIYGLYPIKTTKFNKYDKFNYLLPGVQIRKDIPLAQQKLSIGLQGGINYLTEPSSPFWEEEYKKQNINPNQLALIKDFRKDPSDPNNQIVFNTDKIRQQQEENDNTLMYFAGLSAAILGSASLYRKYGSLLNREMAKTVTSDNNNIDSLNKKLNPGEKLDLSTADRFSFRNNLVEEDLLSEELANDLALDDATKVNSMFETGHLDTVFLVDKPQEVYDYLQSLKINNPEKLKELDDYLNKISKIQDDAYRYNTFIQKGKTNLSTGEYANKVMNNDIIPPNASYLSKDEILSFIKTHKNLPNLIDNRLINLNRDLLKYQYKNGYISEYQYEQLLNNRFDSIFSGYKHIAKDTNDPWYNQLLKYAINEAPYDPNKLPNMNVRGPHGIDADNSKSIADVFEYQVKSTLLDVIRNNKKRNTIEYMQKQQLKKIDDFLENSEEKLDYVKNLINREKDPNEVKKLKKGYNDLLNDYARQIKDLFYIKHIGSKYIDSTPNQPVEPNKLFDLLNTRYNPNNDLHRLLTNYDEGFGALDKYEGMANVANDIVTFIDDGMIHYYKVDPIIASAFNFNPTLPNKFAELMKGMKNVVQSTTTGQLNPAFALPSSAMSVYEALTVFPVIASKLSLMEPASRLQYMKQIGQSMREIVITEHAKNLTNLYTREMARTFGKFDTPMGKYLKEKNIAKMQLDFQFALSTRIHNLGGGSVKPTTRNNGRFFRLSNNTKINDKLKKFIVDHYGLDAGVQIAKTINYLQLALREGPQLALTEYFGKATGAIRNGNVVNEKELKKVIDVISTYTANVGKAGTGKGLLGGIAQSISNYTTYGNIAIQSIAPKLRASGINDGIMNFYRLCCNLADPKMRYVDILMQMKYHGKELVQNKFIQGLLVTSFIPTLISYIWNYGSTKNMNDYHRMSDYDKASKFILTNFFGDGNHLYIPKDQEVAMCDSLIYTMLDGIFGMSAYNKVDPAFKHSQIMMQSVARSLGIDSIPALDLIANISGKEVNLNIFDDRFGINDLSRNNLNNDLSETAYKNGLVNQETSKIINSLFGIFGSALLTIGEEANVGSQNNAELTDARQAFIDKFTKSGKLFGPRQISSFNETSKYVYNQRNLINKIASVEIKNPAQQRVYDFVKIYNKNRIKPIHDKITALRKDIQNVKSTGRLKNGKVLDYNNRKITMSNINKQLQLLFAKEYHEFQNMDKLMQAQFGKNITLNTFMENLNGKIK